MAPHGQAPFKWPVLWGPLCSSRQQAVRPQSKLSQSLYALKEFAAHLLGLHAPATEPSFGFCQQHLEFPSGLPSKHFPGPMLLNLSVEWELVLPTWHGLLMI